MLFFCFQLKKENWCVNFLLTTKANNYKNLVVFVHSNLLCICANIPFCVQLKKNKMVFFLFVFFFFNIFCVFVQLLLYSFKDKNFCFSFRFLVFFMLFYFTFNQRNFVFLVFNFVCIQLK